MGFTTSPLSGKDETQIVWGKTMQSFIYFTMFEDSHINSALQLGRGMVGEGMGGASQKEKKKHVE